MRRRRAGSRSMVQVTGSRYGAGDMSPLDPREPCRPTGPDRTGRGRRRGRCRAGDAPPRPGADPVAQAATPTPTPTPAADPARRRRPSLDRPLRPPRRPNPRPPSHRASRRAVRAAPTRLHRPEAHRQPSATPLLARVLDERLERLRAKYGIPGMSAAILFADGSIWRGAAGDADVETGVPVTPDTSFSVASVSKTFTAALILSLIEDGQLSLDGAAKSYLPSLPIDPAITVRELLDHTSGLRDFYFGAGVDHALLSKPARVWNPARSLKYLGKPYAKPGVEWHYSNTNYLVLGMLAEAVGGAPLADQLQDRFLGPLAPRRHVLPAARRAVAGARRPRLPLPRHDPEAARDRPVGRHRHRAVHLGRDRGGRRRVHRDERRRPRPLGRGAVRRRRAQPRLARRDGRGHRPDGELRPGVAYGLGVQSVTVDGRPALGHSGRFLGARAVVRWLPRERIAIAVLTNQSRTDPNLLLASLLKLAFQPQSDCLSCADIP